MFHKPTLSQPNQYKKIYRNHMHVWQTKIIASQIILVMPLWSIGNSFLILFKLYQIKLTWIFWDVVSVWVVNCWWETVSWPLCVVVPLTSDDLNKMSEPVTHWQTNEPPHDKTNKMACAPSEDSDQPGHPPSLIGVFAVRMKKAWALSYPLSAQRSLWSDWVDAQADLSLRWAHMPFCWFCHEAAHLISWLTNRHT